MNEKIEQQTIIENYLMDVRKKLPHWLKDQRKDVEDIIQQLEDHIWDKAYELSNDKNPTITQIQFVISQMGTPREIASEYKRRGKPKIYITEEFFPWYWKTLVGTGIFSLLVIFLALGLSIGIDPAGEIAKNFAINTSLGLLITFNIVTGKKIVSKNDHKAPNPVAIIPPMMSSTF